MSHWGWNTGTSRFNCGYWCETGRQSLSWSLTYVAQIWCLCSRQRRPNSIAQNQSRQSAPTPTRGRTCRNYFAGADLHFYYSNCPCLPTLFGGWLAERRILNQFEFLNTIRLACQITCFQCDRPIKDFICLIRACGFAVSETTAALNKLTSSGNAALKWSNLGLYNFLFCFWVVLFCFVFVKTNSAQEMFW